VGAVDRKHDPHANSTSHWSRRLGRLYASTRNDAYCRRGQRGNSKYKANGIAYHYVGDIDVLDVDDLQKSALYDARQGIEIILIKANSTFIEEFTSGKHTRTNYMLLAVPTKLGNPQFSTLRQAYALGIQTLWSGTGPP
jgi:hypothetical protein